MSFCVSLIKKSYRINNIKNTNNNDLDKELERQNPLLWFIDKIIKLLVKIFKRRKK